MLTQTPPSPASRRAAPELLVRPPNHPSNSGFAPSVVTSPSPRRSAPRRALRRTAPFLSTPSLDANGNRPHQDADAHAPVSCKPSCHAGATRAPTQPPEQLRLRTVRGDITFPPQLGSAQGAPPNCPHLSALSLDADGTVGPTRPGVRAGAAAGKPSSVPPARTPSFPPTRPSRFPPPSGPAPCRGIPRLSPALRPGSCPPLAPAGAAPPTHRRAGLPVRTSLPEPRPARHSPPPGCAFT